MRCIDSASPTRIALGRAAGTCICWKPATGSICPNLGAWWCDENTNSPRKG